MFNNETIRIAVKLYLENEKEGEEQYGHINTWNVSGVTDMHAMFRFAVSFNQPLNNWDVSNVTDMRYMFNSTTIGEMLKKYNLTNKKFQSKSVSYELFVWPRKKDYVTFLVNNHYLPFNKHQEEHEYHPLFNNPDISKYIAYYL